MRRDWIPVVIVLAMMIALTVEVHPHSRSDLEEQDSFARRTDTVEFELSASEGMSRARFDVRLTMKAGEARWTLTDPEGQVRLTGHGKRGKIEGDTGDLEPIPGIWVFRLRLEEATGTYRVNWHAR